jgi:hypothetical protein
MEGLSHCIDVFLITILLNLLIKVAWFEVFSKVTCICYCISWCFCVNITLFAGRIGKWYLTMLSAFLMILFFIPLIPFKNDWIWIENAEIIYFTCCIVFGGFFGICNLISNIIPKWIAGITLLIRKIRNLITKEQ